MVQKQRKKYLAILGIRHIINKLNSHTKNAGGMDKKIVQ